MTSTDPFKVEVTFPEGPRMWPAALSEPDADGACSFIPIESANWRFVNSRSRWKAYRKQLVL